MRLQQGVVGGLGTFLDDLVHAPQAGVQPGGAGLQRNQPGAIARQGDGGALLGIVDGVHGVFELDAGGPELAIRPVAQGGLQLRQAQHDWRQQARLGAGLQRFDEFGQAGQGLRAIDLVEARGGVLQILAAADEAFQRARGNMLRAVIAEGAQRGLMPEGRILEGVFVRVQRAQQQIVEEEDAHGGGAAAVVDLDQAAVHGLEEGVLARHLLREVVAQGQLFRRKQLLDGGQGRPRGLCTGDAVALHPGARGISQLQQTVGGEALLIVAGDLFGALREARGFGQLAAVPGLPAIRQRASQAAEERVALHITRAGDHAAQLREPG